MVKKIFVYKFIFMFLTLAIILLLVGCVSQPIHLQPEIIESVTPFLSTATLSKTNTPSPSIKITNSVDLLEPASLNLQKPLPDNLLIDIYRMNRPVMVDEVGYDQILEQLGIRSHWPESHLSPRNDQQQEELFGASNASLVPLGCYLKNNGKDNRYPFSLYCQEKAIVINIYLVSPVYVNQSKTDFVVTVMQQQEGIMIAHKGGVETLIPDDWSQANAQYFENQEITVHLEQGQNNQKVVSVNLDKKIVYQMKAEKYVQKPIIGLWTYDSHWALEVVNTIVIDGISINNSKGYQKSYEFHLLNSKPLFFFEKEGKIGLNYDGSEIDLRGDIVPHYNCCSSSLLNPRQWRDVLIFFMNKDSRWYYLEVAEKES